MSGRPIKYTRGEAIAHLLQDRRRDVIKKLAEKGHQPRFYIDHNDNLYKCLTSTAEWLPRLWKLDDQGRLSELAGSSPIDGWPTEDEIAESIKQSAESEKNWDGSLSENDRLAFEELSGIQSKK